MPAGLPLSGGVRGEPFGTRSGGGARCGALLVASTTPFPCIGFRFRNAWESPFVAGMFGWNFGKAMPMAIAFAKPGWIAVGPDATPGPCMWSLSASRASRDARDAFRPRTPATCTLGGGGACISGTGAIGRDPRRLRALSECLQTVVAMLVLGVMNKSPWLRCGPVVVNAKC